MKKKLIIFDFDGVFCWIDKEGVFEGYRAWIDDFLGKPKSYERFFIDMESFLNWFDYDIEKNLERVGCFEEKDINRAHDVFLEVICDKEGDIFPWVDDILKVISKKYKLAILTANSNKRPACLLGDLTHYFEMIVGREDASLKPNPDGIYLILKKLGFNSGDAVIIGDTYADVKAGKAAGIQTGAVKWGFGEWKDLLLLNPDYKFLKPEDLLTF